MKKDITSFAKRMITINCTAFVWLQLILGLQSFNSLHIFQDVLLVLCYYYFASHSFGPLVHPSVCLALAFFFFIFLLILMVIGDCLKD